MLGCVQDGLCQVQVVADPGAVEAQSGLVSGAVAELSVATDIGAAQIDRSTPARAAQPSR